MALSGLSGTSLQLDVRARDTASGRWEAGLWRLSSLIGQSLALLGSRLAASGQVGRRERLGVDLVARAAAGRRSPASSSCRWWVPSSRPLLALGSRPHPRSAAATSLRSPRQSASLSSREERGEAGPEWEERVASGPPGAWTPRRPAGLVPRARVRGPQPLRGAKGLRADPPRAGRGPGPEPAGVGAAPFEGFQGRKGPKQAAASSAVGPSGSWRRPQTSQLHREADVR